MILFLGKDLLQFEISNYFFLGGYFLLACPYTFDTDASSQYTACVTVIVFSWCSTPSDVALTSVSSGLLNTHTSHILHLLPVYCNRLLPSQLILQQDKAIYCTPAGHFRWLQNEYTAHHVVSATLSFCTHTSKWKSTVVCHTNISKFAIFKGKNRGLVVVGLHVDIIITKNSAHEGFCTSSCWANGK